MSSRFEWSCGLPASMAKWVLMPVRSPSPLPLPSPLLLPAPALRLARWCLAAFMGLFMLMPAFADPPGRVGRIGESSGTVWLLRESDGSAENEGDWVEAVRNEPVTGGDRIATEEGASAEIDIGSTTLRLAEGTELQVLRLDDTRISVQVERGSMAARLRTRAAADEFDALSNEGRFVALHPGLYRIDQTAEGTQATSLDGTLRFDGPGSTLMVEAGQRADIRLEDDGSGQGQARAAYTLGLPGRDAFADWVAARDAEETRLVTPVQVSPEMTGAGDLARYGNWSQTQEYGALWTPVAVAPDWAPYRQGRWAYVQPWGWTWVDDAPWGFAPFHYGRWVRYRNAWCWAPGTYVRRPVYAPALVGWVGGAAPGVSIQIGSRPSGPGVGWFPLAPREVFVPGYRVSPGYVRNINVSHVGNRPDFNRFVSDPAWAAQQNRYVNRGIPNAVTAAPFSAFNDRNRGGPSSGWRWQGRDAGFMQGFDRLPGRALPPVAAPPRIERPRGEGPRGGPSWDRGNGSRPLPSPGVAPGFGGRPPGVVAPAPGIATPGAPGMPPGFQRPGRPDVSPGAGRPGGGVGIAPGSVPGVVTTPGWPVSPRQPGQPGTWGTPDRADRPGRPDRPDRPQSPGRPDRPGIPERPDRPSAAGRIGSPELPRAPAMPDRPAGIAPVPMPAQQPRGQEQRRSWRGEDPRPARPQLQPPAPAQQQAPPQRPVPAQPPQGQDPRRGGRGEEPRQRPPQMQPQAPQRQPGVQPGAAGREAPQGRPGMSGRPGGGGEPRQRERERQEGFR